MDNPFTQKLNRSIKFCILLSYMALCTTMHYSISTMMIPIIAILIFPWTSKIEEGHRWYTHLSTILTLGFMAFIPMFVLSNGLVDGVIVLFMFVQLYSLLHKKEASNYMHIIMMSVFIYIATLVLSPSPLIGIIFIAFIYNISLSMMTLERWRLYNECTPFDQKQSHSLTSHKPAATHAQPFVLCAYIMTITIVMFMMLPRVEAGIMGSTLANERARAVEIRDDARFDLVGRITGNNTTIMTVEFAESSNTIDRDEMYWRATTLDKYSPEGWTREGLSTPPRRTGHRLLAGFLPQRKTRNNTSNIVKRQTLHSVPAIRYEVVFSEGVSSFLPLLNTVTSMNVVNQKGYTDISWVNGRDFSVEMDTRFIERFRVSSQLLKPTPEELRQTSENYLDIMEVSDFQLLTEQYLQQRTLELVDTIIADRQSNYDKVQAIEDYMTGFNYYYTDDVPELDKEHPLDNFIHDVRQGHCELFAGAMTLMVRSLGIPARAVSGYQGGQYNSTDQSYTIKSYMAHMWLEVYFPEYGWVTFDPTPSIDDIEFSPAEKFQQKISLGITYVNNFWLRNVIAYKPQFKFNPMNGGSLTLFSNWTASLLDGRRSGTLKATDYVKIGIVIGTPILFIVAILRLIQRLATHKNRARNLRLSEEQRQARELYIKLIKKLTALGISIDNLTADEVLEQLKVHQAFPVDELESIAQFLVRYHEIRFGQQTLHEHELNQFSSMIKQLNQQPAT